jgi:hypothetical protein
MLNTARSQHTATLLPNGQVLVAGGCAAADLNCRQGLLTSTELYDFTSGRWIATGALTTTRAQHTATLLSNGQVLVAGGSQGEDGPPQASAELYQPAGGTWGSTASSSDARSSHSATSLPSGRVLVAGGCWGPEPCGALNRTEVYDPSSTSGPPPERS